MAPSNGTQTQRSEQDDKRHVSALEQKLYQCGGSTFLKVATQTQEITVEVFRMNAKEAPWMLAALAQACIIELLARGHLGCSTCSAGNFDEFFKELSDLIKSNGIPF